MKRVLLAALCVLFLCSCATRETVSSFAQRLALDAQALIDSGANEKAIALLERGLNVDSCDSGVLTHLAVAYANTGAAQKAMDTLAAALNTDKTNLNACVRVADAFIAQGTSPDKVFSLWLSANKDDDAAGKAFAQHYIDTGDRTRFESYCRLWMREQPTSYAAASALADAVELNGDAEGANNIRMSYFTRVAELNPDDINAAKALADYLSTTGATADAQQVLIDFYQARLTDAADDKTAIVGLYEIYKYQQNNEAILTLLSGYLALKPDDADIRGMLNTTRVAMGMREVNPGAMPESAGDIVQVAAGTTIMGYLKTTGELYLWGANYDGEVTGDAEPQMGYTAAPSPIKRMDGIAQFSLGGAVRPDVYGYTLAVTKEGVLYGFGYNAAGILDTPSVDKVLEPKALMENIRAVSAGYNHAVAVGMDSSLYAWGNNTYGQLGDGTQTATSTPKQVMTDVAKAVAGYGFTVILKRDGSLWVCGWNAEDAEYGVNSDKRLLVPKKLMDGVVDIAVNRWDVYAIDQLGVLWAYRGAPDPENDDNPGGNGAWTPTAHAEQFYEDVRMVSGSHGRFAALLTDTGELYTWGSNSYACLGVGVGDPNRPEGAIVSTPELVMSGVVQMSAGAFNGIALKNDGTMMSWGSGEGMIGDGKHDGINKPTNVPEI